MAYDDEVLADAPVIYWRLNETSGTTAADSSGNGNVGEYVQGISASLNPVFGSAFVTSETTFAAARDATGAPPEPGGSVVGQFFSGSTYNCYEHFVAFDLSTITTLPTTVKLVFQVFWTVLTDPLDAPFNLKVAYLGTGTVADETDWQTGADLAGLTALNTTLSESTSEGAQIEVDLDPNDITWGDSVRFIFWTDNMEGAGTAPTGNEVSAMFVNVMTVVGPLTGGYVLNSPGLLVGDSDPAVLLSNDDTTLIGVQSSTWPPTDQVLSEFTIEAMVYFDDLRHAWGYNFIAGFLGPEANGDVEIYAGSSGADDVVALFAGTDDFVYASGDYPILVNTAYHFVLRYDGTNIDLYLDGGLVITRGLTGDITIPAGYPFRVGSDGYGQDGVQGTVDEAAFYDYALSPARIAIHAAASGVVPPDVGVPPTVDSIDPSVGSTAGGASVIITGSGFVGVTDVEFGIGTPAASFTVDNDTQITAVSPAHAAGDVDLTVTDPDGSSSAVFTYGVPPTITNLSPNSGPTGGGTSVTVTGTGFLSGGDLYFGATIASYGVVDDTTLIATSPAHALGTVYVTFVSFGTSATGVDSEFTYVGAPVVTNVGPSSGPVTGGTSVVIAGAGFVSVTSVRFGATAATSFTVDSTTQITATAPAHAVGVVHITVVATLGTSATSGADQYTFTAGPAAPTGVAAVAGDAQASLSWTAPAGTVTDYEVTVYSVSGSAPSGVTGATSRLVGSATTNFVFTGLTNGTTYRFRVAGINTFGTGSQSVLSNAVTPSSGVIPPDEGVGKVSWYFTDLVTSTTYVFAVNPKEGGAPAFQKNIVAKPTLVGEPLVFQGLRKPATFEWSGTLFTQEQHVMFLEWWQKRHQIQLVDDLGRTSFVYVTDFDAKRERASRSPYKHSYTMKATELMVA